MATKMSVTKAIEVYEERKKILQDQIDNFGKGLYPTLQDRCESKKIVGHWRKEIAVCDQIIARLRGVL
jgi:hypothetical protein